MNEVKKDDNMSKPHDKSLKAIQLKSNDMFK